MIHTLEAFDVTTGHRVKRGTVVRGQSTAYELGDIEASTNPVSDGFVCLVLARGEDVSRYLFPRGLNLFVRDLTKPDYSGVKTGLEALEMISDALADLTLRTVATERAPEPVEGF